MSRRPLVSSSPSFLARRVHHDLPLKTNRNLLGSRLQFTWASSVSKALLLRPCPLRGRSLSSPLWLQPATRLGTRMLASRGVEEDFGFRMRHGLEPLGIGHGESWWKILCRIFFSFLLTVFRFLNTRYVIYMEIMDCAGYYMKDLFCFFFFLVWLGEIS